MSTPSRLRELPVDERPREKLVRAGAGALADTELLAIFLRTGTPGRNAIATARDLLDKWGGLQGLSRCEIRDLINSARGVGTAKACELAAAFELGKRLARGGPQRPKVDSPEALYHLLGPEMQALRDESVRVVLLDTKYQVIRVEEVSSGTLNECIAHPRNIFRPALVYSAFAVAVVHNHPSGDPAPSEADRRLTRRLNDSAAALDIRLLDHVIIGTADGGRTPYTSFRELGLL